MHYDLNKQLTIRLSVYFYTPVKIYVNSKNIINTLYWW